MAYVPPPEYRSGEYSTVYYLITEDEKEVLREMIQKMYFYGKMEDIQGKSD